MTQDPDNGASSAGSDHQRVRGESASSAERHRGRRRFFTAAATVLALVGVVLVGRFVLGQQTPPQPEPRAAGSESGRAASAKPTEPYGQATAEPSQPPRLPRSVPEHIDIPAIDADAPVMTLGKKKDGTIEVPPHEEPSRAGWYENSATPGEFGPSIILGHVDSEKYGPAVFYRLASLTEGAVVEVTRADGTVARFRVTDVATYPKDRFPTERIYGASDHSVLRLISCGGTFDPAEGSYEDNVVAYASFGTGGS